MGLLKRIGDADRKRGLASTLMLTYAAYRDSGALTQFSNPEAPMSALNLLPRTAELARTIYGVALSGVELIVWPFYAAGVTAYRAVFGGWTNYPSDLHNLHYLHNWDKIDGLGRTGLEAIVQTGANGINGFTGFVNNALTFSHMHAISPDAGHQAVEWLNQYHINPFNAAIGIGVYYVAKHLRKQYRLGEGHPATGGHDE